MPATAMIATDANFRGVQVGGSSPKIALFPRNGQLYTRASFTSTQAGTAQVAIAGLKAGTYAVNGPTSLMVTAGPDGLLYFEGDAGAYSIAMVSSGSSTLQKARAGGKVVLR